MAQTDLFATTHGLLLREQTPTENEMKNDPLALTPTGHSSEIV